jgi:hypothetical protein
METTERSERLTNRRSFLLEGRGAERERSAPDHDQASGANRSTNGPRTSSRQWPAVLERHRHIGEPLGLEPHNTNIEGGKNMHVGWKSARAFIALVVLCVFSTAGQASVALAQGSTNGAAGQMPAFYEGELVTVNMKEMPDNAAGSLIGKNPSVNTIYASNDLDEEQEFMPVIDAIQGEGFNPLWQQVLIVFNEGFTPHQFVSEAQVLAAAAGPDPEITLNVTDEVYRCSVVGPK